MIGAFFAHSAHHISTTATIAPFQSVMQTSDKIHGASKLRETNKVTIAVMFSFTRPSALFLSIIVCIYAVSDHFVMRLPKQQPTEHQNKKKQKKQPKKYVPVECCWNGHLNSLNSSQHQPDEKLFTNIFQTVTIFNWHNLKHRLTWNFITST